MFFSGSIVEEEVHVDGRVVYFLKNTNEPSAVSLDMSMFGAVRVNGPFYVPDRDFMGEISGNNPGGGPLIRTNISAEGIASFDLMFFETVLVGSTLGAGYQWLNVLRGVESEGLIPAPLASIKKELQENLETATAYWFSQTGGNYHEDDGLMEYWHDNFPQSNKYLNWLGMPLNTTSPFSGMITIRHTISNVDLQTASQVRVSPSSVFNEHLLLDKPHFPSGTNVFFEGVEHQWIPYHGQKEFPEYGVTYRRDVFFDSLKNTGINPVAQLLCKHYPSTMDTTEVCKTLAQMSQAPGPRYIRWDSPVTKDLMELGFHPPTADNPNSFKLAVLHPQHMSNGFYSRERIEAELPAFKDLLFTRMAEGLVFYARAALATADAFLAPVSWAKDKRLIMPDKAMPEGVPVNIFTPQGERVRQVKTESWNEDSYLF